MSDVRRSAALILHRTGRGEVLEIFLVERSRAMKHWGGLWAFPGGAVESQDACAPVAGAAALDAAEREAIACAARELLEELGILAAGPAGPDWPAAEVEALRGRLLAGDKTAWTRWLEERGASVNTARFARLTRLVTPRFSVTRFDTTFFLVRGDAEPAVIPGELAGGLWISPAAALDAWRRREMAIAPPVVDLLDVLAASGVEGAMERCRGEAPEFERSDRSVRLAPGYEVVPVETPPLPANIPTNVFLAGGERFVLIDPAPRRAVEQDHVFRVVDRRLARGDKLIAVVLSHHHPDHVGALEPAMARYRAPLWAHRITGELLKLRLDRELDDGDAIELGASPDGRDGWVLRVLFTPGHAEGHLVFHDERFKTLVAGDLVSTLVSMYVGAPGGSLRQYFASVERVQRLDVETLLPSHGTASSDPRKLLDETLRHRRARIEEFAAILAVEPIATLDAAVRVYPDAGGKLRPLIERTTRAALEYLVEDGRAERAGVDFYRRRTAR